MLADNMSPEANQNACVHIIDDDEDMRDFLRFTLESAGLNVSGHNQASSFLQTFDLWQPGCVVLDLKLSDQSGLEVQNELKSLPREIPVLFISAHGDIPTVVQAMRNGAVGFISKPIDPADFLDQVRHALNRDCDNIELAHQRMIALERIAKLTPRERQVLEQVAAGHPNKIIARNLDISPKTVELHRSSVMRKLNADSVADLVKVVLLYL